MRVATATGVLAAAALALALYGTAARLRNARPPEPCAGADAVRARLEPLARGAVAALDLAGPTRPAPAIRFRGPDGADLDLAAFGGRTLLVNLWARWCAPCKAEMPALDRLQQSLGGDRFAVIALNVETRDLDGLPDWLARAGIGLPAYADPAGRVLPVVQKETGSAGLPTTLLIDPRGCTLGVMKGPADWGGQDGLRLIRAALDPAP